VPADTPQLVNRATAYFFSFAFWGYFTRKKNTGGCREN
jgi:hypothetical protein